MKKTFRVAVTILASVVACIGVVFGILALIFGSFKSHPAYRMGMDLAKNDPMVIELFGSPVKDGFFVVGTTKEFRYGNDIANWETSISGPREHGTISIYGNEEDHDVWHIRDMTIRVDGRTVLVYRDDEPGEGFRPVR